jgi:hypothetical protein
MRTLRPPRRSSAYCGTAGAPAASGSVRAALVMSSPGIDARLLGAGGRIQLYQFQIPTGLLDGFGAELLRIAQDGCLECKVTQPDRDKVL